MQASWQPPPVPHVRARTKRSSLWLVCVLPILGAACLVVGFVSWDAGERFWSEPEASAREGALLINGVTTSIEARIQNELLLQGFASRGREYIAIINDQIVSANDVVMVDLGPRTYQLRVKAIEDGRIILGVL